MASDSRIKALMESVLTVRSSEKSVSLEDTLRAISGDPIRQQLAEMDFGALRSLRDKYPSKADQNLLAPFEHRAYARETVESDPLSALVLPGLSIGYNASKLLGQSSGRSDPSFEAIGSAMAGVREGLKAGIGSKLKKLVSSK